MPKRESVPVTVRESFPFGVETIDPQWVVLKDGTRLACTLWRPQGKVRSPVVVEMVPYRRRDGTVFRDLELHPYLAGHGVACLRVDIRGSGDSDGVLLDEYLPQEIADACEVIAWAAEQPWCNGSVGMTGISWGGFNALQTAAMQPPALKAIITLCSGDDRYADDVHYMGGALLTENEMWSNYMLAQNSMPPDPQIVGARWRKMWMQRLDNLESWSHNWLAHQRRDSYWKQGSVCEDYSRITCAVLAVCGWEDSYSNSVPRLLEHLTCPKKGIMGPWSHSYPCRNDPGPRIGYLQEALRWWKYWLEGEETGIMTEPLFRAWIGDEERPQPFYKEHAGHWVAEESWPSRTIDWRTLYFNAHGLGPEPVKGTLLTHSSPATAGTDYGRWGGYGGESPDLAIDQRREDGQSLCFDTEVLVDDLTLLGAVELELELIVDKPLVNLAARLCDVYPDGTSAVITYGVLNLSHRNSHEIPEPCPVDRPFTVRFKLNDLGRTVPRGHKLRIALQNQFWFVLWPQPELSLVTLASGKSLIRLPVRKQLPGDSKVAFEPAEVALPAPVTSIRAGLHKKVVEDDIGTGFRTITLLSDFGSWRIEDRCIGGSATGTDVFRIHPADPLTAELASEYAWSSASGDAVASGSARTRLSATAEHFRLDWEIEVREQEKIIFTRSGSRKFARDYC